MSTLNRVQCTHQLLDGIYLEEIQLSTLNIVHCAYQFLGGAGSVSRGI